MRTFDVQSIEIEAPASIADRSRKRELTWAQKKCSV
jgi:hypothetical protein